MALKRICLLILMSLAFAGQVNALDTVNLSEPDKNLHMGLSYNLTAAGAVSIQKMGYSNTQATFVSGGMVLLMGILKEYVHDRQPDVMDIQADLVGTLVGMTIPFRIEF